MMKLIKTSPATTIAEEIQFAKNDAANIQKNIADLTGIPFSNLKIIDLTDLIDADVILHAEGDEAAGKRVISNLKVYDNMLTHNASFVEDKINAANDPDLANRLFYPLKKHGGLGNQPAIRGENTNNKSELKITIVRVIMEGPKPKFAHHYDVFAALVTDEGVGIDSMVGQLFKAKGFIKGFNSGDKYSIYAIPYDIDGNAGKPTPSFIIRIN